METADELIFVSIASYRDGQLVATVNDLLCKAEDSTRLRVRICWQHGDEEKSLPFALDARFQILDVDWRESRGACWARAQIMQLWDGEAFFLQIDSHCRFAAGWDAMLIRMMKETGSSKPVLSSYGNAFTPAENGSDLMERLTGPPQSIVISRFTSDGIPELRPLEMHDVQHRSSPMSARFVSGGFLFGPGSFVKDVPYDPDLYFLGEESSMSLRAFTSGYDLFHPHEAVVWHDYGRADATRHWQDHDASELSPNDQLRAWKELDRRSKERLASLFVGEKSIYKAGQAFGLGAARTLEEYEQYAGINFRLRLIHDRARRGCEPPTVAADDGWTSHVYPWLVRVTLTPSQLEDAAFSQEGFWMVLIEDEYHQEIYRQDFGRKDLEVFTGSEPVIALVCEFKSGLIPAFWTVWPFSAEAGWCEKATGALPEHDYTILRPEPADSLETVRPSDPIFFHAETEAP